MAEGLATAVLGAISNYLGCFIWWINKAIMRSFGMRSEAAKKSLAVVENVGESYELGYKKS